MPLFLWWKKRDRERTEEGKREEENGEKEGGHTAQTYVMRFLSICLTNACAAWCTAREREERTPRTVHEIRVDPAIPAGPIFVSPNVRETP